MSEERIIQDQSLQDLSPPNLKVEEKLVVGEIETKSEFSMADHQDFTKKRTERAKQIIWPVLSIVSAAIGVGLGLNNLFDFVPLDKVGINLAESTVSNLAFLLSIVGPTIFNAIGEKLEKKRKKAQEKQKAEAING